ncbi:hypothetical protein [Gracilimonas mengyeensis]|nr:hypothetical protein [Gracilimonas mengyeensis]
MSKRKALIGFSSPVGFYYDLESERGRPGPIIESPFSLLLFYDELWFVSRSVCPYNMEKLDYVHFVDEELLTDGLSADFTKGIEDPPEIKKFPWDTWEQTIHQAFLPEARYDNHGRSQGFGELGIYPTPGSYDNFLVDHYIANKFGLELLENSVNAKWMMSFEESLLTLQTSEKLLAPCIPSLQSLEGPYHPFVDDLRSDNLLMRYRSKIQEVSTNSKFEELDSLKQDLNDEYNRIVAELASSEFSNARIVDGAASLTLGQVPVISNITSGIQGVRELAKTYKNRKEKGWVGFIARTITKSREK